MLIMKTKEFSELQESSKPVVAKARHDLGDEMVRLKEAVSKSIFESHKNVIGIIESVIKDQSVEKEEFVQFANASVFNLVMHSVEATIATVWSLVPEGVNLGALIADANAEAMMMIHEMAVEADGFPAKSCPCVKCSGASIKEPNHRRYDA